MRDLLMLAIVGSTLPFVFRHTWVGVLLWTWISIMNPHKLAFGFAYDAPWAALVAVVTLISVLFNRDKLSMPWDPPVKALLAFVIWTCITTAFAFYPVLSWDQLIKVLKIQLMTAIAFAALRERKHIEFFIWIMVLSIGFYGFKGGIFTIAGGGEQRVWGPPGGFIEGNNEIGLALVVVIPLMNYLRAVATRGWIRWGLLALMALSATAALGTQSRGALLAVFAMGLMLWIQSKQKIRAAIFMISLATVLLALMSLSWETRMRTIIDYDQDSSAMGRINAWKMAFNLANHQLFGGGFEMYSSEVFARYAPIPEDIHAAHSIYFQVLGEHGYIGLILFLLIWFFTFRTAGKVRAEAQKRPETQWLESLVAMCQVSLIGYAVGGAFLSLAYFDLPYDIVIVLVVSLRWLREKRWESDTQGAFGSAASSSPIRATTQKKIQQWF